MIRIKRLIKSFGYAAQGLARSFFSEQNLRVQAAMALLAIVFGAVAGITRTEWALIIGAIGLVFIMELVNSAVERTADLLKPRLDGYVKEIKDIMAAAVLAAALTAAGIGLLVFWPYAMRLAGL